MWKIRSDLIDTYKIISGIYNVKTELFFDYDQSGRRGQKRRCRPDIRKFAFSSWIVDRWNSLSECCVRPTCNSINCFKSHISSKLEPETTWSVDILESGLYGIKPVPTKPSVCQYWWPSVNSVNSDEIDWASSRKFHAEIERGCGCWPGHHRLQMLVSYYKRRRAAISAVRTLSSLRYICCRRSARRMYHRSRTVDVDQSSQA